MINNMKTPLKKLIVVSLLAFSTASIQAQDSGPLIDKLVQKGILNDQEAEDLRADLVKDFNQTPAGKLNFSSSVKELKFYGDARYRYQFDDQQKQVATPDHDTQRSRNRFRLRLYTDLKLTDNFFAGFGLETGQPSDTSNQTVDSGYSDTSIYISRWFLGYNLGEFATIVLGKQKNPFYGNELYWDADIQPVGLTESVAFHKLFGYEEKTVSNSSAYSKDGKSVPNYTTTSTGFDWGNFELTLVSGQFIYETNNDEAAKDSDSSNDVYMFESQLIASYKFENKVALTIAPAFIFYNAGEVSSVVKDGSLNGQPFAESSVSGEVRDLYVVNIPGELKFPLGNLNGRFYGELAWNIKGEDRFTDVLGISPTVYDDQQSLAWLLGLEIGQGKGAGAWTLFANYRQVGIAALDPNLNDSDFALSRLNIQGLRVGATYSLTDFLTVGVTAQLGEDLDDGIRGGQATAGANLADRNSVNVYQLDIGWKF